MNVQEYRQRLLDVEARLSTRAGREREQAREQLIVWYEVAFKNYVAANDDHDVLPTKATLQQFVIRQRQRGLRPVTCNT